MLLRYHRKPTRAADEVEPEAPTEGDSFEPVDPADFTVEQVIEYLAIASPERAAAVIAQEAAGKQRKGILEYVKE